jgi:hypothetical protein
MGKRSSNAKVWGKTANPCFAGHALMDNRHSLITDVSIIPSVGLSESEAALLLLARQRRKRLRSKSVGADKGYHTLRFLEVPREKRIAAHVALDERYHALGLGRGVSESRAYRASQIVRKRIEHLFSWDKTVGGKGLRRNAQLLYLTGVAYNLVRMSRLRLKRKCLRRTLMRGSERNVRILRPTKAPTSFCCASRIFTPFDSFAKNPPLFSGLLERDVCGKSQL